MYKLKPISRDSIPEALEKAERYRLLKEPRLAESICLDILDAEPTNTKALVIMLLAVTDQFGSTTMADVNQAKQLLQRLPDAYEKEYYAGIICERQGKSILTKDIPDGNFIAYEWLTDAMEHYEKAEAIRPPNNDDTLLRWNTCARLIMRNHLQPRNEKFYEHPLE
jgi:hypothetical protein